MDGMREGERGGERCENQIVQVFWAGVGLKPAISVKEGRHAKHPAIGNGKSIACPQSSQFDLSDTMHGYMDTMPDTG
jgi:hypothetical protein